MNKLETIIDKMLKENTGRHFLDSGGAYGRHWEQNQERDYTKEEATILRVKAEEDGEITELYVMFNLFHFLTAHLDVDEFTEKIEREFYEFGEKEEWDREPWEDVLEAFRKEKKIKVKHSDYTYNHDCILTQDIVFWECEFDGEDFLILRIHNGCDARSGFTSPKFFRFYDYFFMAMNTIYCSCNGGSLELVEGVNALFDAPGLLCRNNWMSDDGGYHWYYDGGCPSEKDLFESISYDHETKKCVCKECHGEIIFSVIDSW